MRTEIDKRLHGHVSCDWFNQLPGQHNTGTERVMRPIAHKCRCWNRMLRNAPISAASCFVFWPGLQALGFLEFQLAVREPCRTNWAPTIFRNILVSGAIHVGTGS